MSFVNSPETLKKEIETIFTDNYPTYQTAINNRWNDGVSLPAYKNIYRGDVNSPREVKEWPSLAILSGDVFPVIRTEQRKDIYFHTRIYLRTFLRDSKTDKLDKWLDRTLEAQMLMFEDAPYSTLNGLVASIEFLLAEPTDSFNPAGSTGYMRALETQWEARHR